MSLHARRRRFIWREEVLISYAGRWLVLHDRPQPAQLFGALLVLVGGLAATVPLLIVPEPTLACNPPCPPDRACIWPALLNEVPHTVMKFFFVFSVLESSDICRVVAAQRSRLAMEACAA